MWGRVISCRTMGVKCANLVKNVNRTRFLQHSQSPEHVTIMMNFSKWICSGFVPCHLHTPQLTDSITKSLTILSNPRSCPVRTFNTLANSRKICNGKSPHFFMIRHISSKQEQKYQQSILIYICAAGIFMLGMAYAGVPLYRMFCQSSGLGGQAVQGHDTSKIETMMPVRNRDLKIRFNADTASSMQWNFRPLQSEITVLPGETALAFYTAKNPTDKPIIGISTYNVVPYEAGQYFNKIQCFCFEEQRLNPHEEVDMPVFFYIDPEYSDDPKLEKIDIITLSYTFFEAKEGINLPVPSYATSNH